MAQTLVNLHSNPPSSEFAYRAACIHRFVRCGYFFRACDQRKIQRFRCALCGFYRSMATGEVFYRHRKRKVFASLYAGFASTMSQRRCAIVMALNRKTVVRKFRLLGKLSLNLLELQNCNRPLVEEFVFDDLETNEHTKCKPLSVTIAVERESRRVLGFTISKMPAKGRIASISRKKYGPRKDERALGRFQLFTKIQPLIHHQAFIRSDDNKHYVKDVRRFFPKGTHLVFKSSRSSDTGQGELKKIKRDPLFAINHTLAKFRADINRLIRKTWCTTKLASQLNLHIAIMATFHNYFLEHSTNIAPFKTVFETTSQWETLPCLLKG